LIFKDNTFRYAGLLILSFCFGKASAEQFSAAQEPVKTPTPKGPYGPFFLAHRISKVGGLTLTLTLVGHDGDQIKPTGSDHAASRCYGRPCCDQENSGRVDAWLRSHRYLPLLVGANQETVWCDSQIR